MDGLMRMQRAWPPCRLLLFLPLIVFLHTPTHAMTNNATAQALIDRVEAALPEHVGAAVLVIDNGQVIFRHGYGLADVESNTPVTPRTNFRMASVSKQFTATSVMLLADEGRVSIDDTLDQFFPGFPAYGKHITVRHVLNHTSGLPDYEDLVPEGTTLQLHDRDVLKIILDTDKPLFEPGTRYKYSNTGYSLLALMVEQVADQPFHTFVHDRIFKPCGMDRSAVYIRGLNEVQDRAFGHNMRDGQWVRDDQSVTSAVLGDGGIYSSIDDLTRWVAALHEERLLKPQTYKAMYTPPLIDGKSTGYGFGWRIDTYKGQTRIHHTGSTRGFSLCLQRFPERNAAVIVLINNSIDEDSMTPAAERVSDVTLFGAD
jgi:CubicO group peptidase (beta-lactamase class C family)